MLATMVPLSVRDSLAFLPLDCIRFRCFYHQMQTSDSLWSTWFVQTYFSWHMWRGRGRDQVDWGQGEPPTLYDTGLHHQPILPPFDFLMNFDWSRFSTSKYEIILVIFFRRELPIFWASVSRLPTWHRPFAASPTPCGIGMKLKEGQFTEENLRYGVFFSIDWLNLWGVSYETFKKWGPPLIFDVLQNFRTTKMTFFILTE